MTSQARGDAAGSGDRGGQPGASRRPQVLLALTGSVATIKWQEIVRGLTEAGCDVTVMATRAAAHFVAAAADGPAPARVHTDDEEWRAWEGKGDPVLHIELRRRADILVFAPLSANTLAKLAHGLCDNLVTAVARAWDPARPVLACPAMNTMMWEHPHTARHLAELAALGYRVLGPVSKPLACGDVGNGAMSEPADVVAETLRLLGSGAPG